MSGRKNGFVIFGFAASVSLIASALVAMLVSFRYSQLQFEMLDAICGEALEQGAGAERIIFAALKGYKNGHANGAAKGDVLAALGYRASDFSAQAYRQDAFFAVAGFLAGVLLFAITFLYRNRKEAMRIQDLAERLEQVNTGKVAILPISGEDGFSKLEDEIYKTVTFLYHTKETAVQAKNEFAENLSNIAHQLKTPITAISLSLQMMGQDFARSQSDAQTMGQDFAVGYLEKIQKQLLRLAHLEEALLVLSQMDAGTLLLRKDEVDVYTLLVLAADNLQELFASSGTSMDIPELGGMAVVADLDWTMEAVMNLMKNCMEHGNGRAIHCSYAQNPLYTEILIWDEGEGFVEEDIPHLFERFYRGKNAGGGGIGIGLALSREILERQNGTIRAKNRLGGGACFEIRFYGGNAN